MTFLNPTNLPPVRPWETKVSAMPNIPRGEKGYPNTLHTILNHLQSDMPINSLISFEGSNRKTSLEDLCISLRPSGFVKRTVNGWILTGQSKELLNSPSNDYLAAVLSSNIKFFSEILGVLHKKGSLTSSELQEIASTDYKISWKTKSEIHARISWLRDLNLISFEDFSLKYSITDEGIQFIDTVHYVKPEDLVTYSDQTLEEKKVPASDWAFNILNNEEADITKRKNGFGYCPGSVQNMHNTILDYLLMMSTPTDFSTILDYSSITFGISESSTRAFISTLINLNLIERKTKTLYVSTELGKKFPSENFELDFSFCINAKIAFVFEILLELEKKSLSVKDLTVISKVSFNFPSENTTEISKRLHILKNAQLIQETGYNQYGLTNRGKLLCKHINPVKSLISPVPHYIQSDGYNSEIDELLNEIRVSSKDSVNPNRFEKVLNSAFQVLGFKSEWLGGSGKTDVLVQAPTSPKFAYKVAVDAKANYSGGVGEGQINFDTILDHKKKHKADYSIIIGHKFQGGRLIERATKHQVALLDVETLETLIKMHLEVPLKSDSYKKIFSQKGQVIVDPILLDREKLIREGKLLRVLMECLVEESNDSLTEGIMQPREIYLLLKTSSSLNPLPGINEIEQMLEFLSSPQIGCVEKTKEGYYALGSLSDAAQKFDFYSQACTKIDKKTTQ
ncbi:restriction endonuclease [Exiguobacterium marinum]|uniref:Restriction endonuclease n=1 Tax=Exiguobacterium marinum TaxID=273528 RepID=A0ABY7X0Q1_9BACL|nr:restriction endonuclease [Exiguobacterium marinum]WDH76703.1 restriction endonuclease [Exiguobacterium marinum]